GCGPVAPGGRPATENCPVLHGIGAGGRGDVKGEAGGGCAGRGATGTAIGVASSGVVGAIGAGGGGGRLGSTGTASDGAPICGYCAGPDAGRAEGGGCGAPGGGRSVCDTHRS
ncbi:MAG TPA: hypothetical protein PLI95_05830, partial [Polyangiaceae bacterium]|nr:hypothetical protein [Polyangiaceae bacterium]